MDRPLLVVDGDNLAHRAYHSMPKSQTGPAGEPINAIVGAVSMLVRLWNKESPRAVYVAWDTLEADTYRNRLWPPYQTGRVYEPDIVRQLGQLPEVCRAFGFGVGKGAGYEADDFVAGAVAAEVGQGGTCLVLTTDRDAWQLVSERVTVLTPKRGARELERIGPDEVEERLGVRPDQVADFKALSGDSSDRIPGVRGVGPKSAVALLRRYGSLDAVLPTLSAEDAELARMFREIVRPRVPDGIELPPSGAPGWATGAELLRSLGAERLSERLT